MAFEWLSSVFSSSAAKRIDDMSFDDARPAFFKAIKNADLDALTALSQKFPDALEWENDRGTSLYIALHHKQLGAFKHLVDLGADIDTQAADKSCLMQVAAQTNRKDFVRFMLEQGVKNIGDAEDYARAYKYFDIADMIKRKDIIRADYVAKNPPATPAPSPVTASVQDVSTDTKIELLSPVQLKKAPDAATP